MKRLNWGGVRLIVQGIAAADELGRLAEMSRDSEEVSQEEEEEQKEGFMPEIEDSGGVRWGETMVVDNRRCTDKRTWKYGRGGRGRCMGSVDI